MASINQHPATATNQATSQVREIPIADSSFLQHIRYDPTTFQLTVTMKSGAQYLHFYVYPMTVDQLLQSPSKGKFYGEAIKGKHPSTTVIHKGAGEPVHNSLRGPIEHERKQPRKQFARVA